MKKKVTFCLTLLFAHAVIAQQPVMMKYIPADAKMVVNFNPLQLAAKVPGDHFRQSMFYKQLIEKGESGLKTFFSDPSVTGIDFASNLWVVATQEGPEPETPGISIFGVLKDRDLFAKTIEKLSKGEQGVKQYGTDRVLLPEGGGPALAWNNEVFVITMPGKKKPTDISEDDEETMYDTTAAVPVDTIYDDTDMMTEEDFEAQWAAELERKMKALRNYCFELLTPKKEHGVTTNPVFLQAMIASGDVRMWTDGSQKTPMQKLNPMAKELSRLAELGGKQVTTVVHFENGQISAVSNNYPNAEALALYKKYPHPAAPVELLKRLPQQPVMGLFVGAFNINLAKEMVKEAGLQSLADSLKQTIPFLDKLPEAFAGSIMIALLKSDRPVEEAQKLKGMEVIIALPVTDKSKVDAMHAEIKKMMASEKENGKMTRLLDGFKSGIRYNENVLVMATTESAAQAFLDNAGTSAVPAWLQDTKYPFLANIDFGAIVKAILAKGGKGGSKGLNEKVFDLFDHITFAGGHLNGNSLEGRFTISFTDKQANAVVQIFDFINYYLEQDAKRKEGM